MKWRRNFSFPNFFFPLSFFSLLSNFSLTVRTFHPSLNLSSSYFSSLFHSTNSYSYSLISFLLFYFHPLVYLFLLHHSHFWVTFSMHSPIYPLIHLSIHSLIHPFDPFTLLFIFCLLFIFIHSPLFPLCLLYSSYSSLFIFTPPSTLFSFIHLVPPLLILSPPFTLFPFIHLASLYLFCVERRRLARRSSGQVDGASSFSLLQHTVVLRNRGRGRT